MSSHIKRGFGWIADRPDFRDKYMQINYFRRFSVVLPSEYDEIRPRMPACYNQSNLSSCTGFGIAAAVQYGHIRQNKPAIFPSQLFIYYNERVMEGTVSLDAGAEIRDGIKSLGRYGVCGSDRWPYVIKKLKTKPPLSAYLKARKDLVTNYQRVPQTVDYLKATLAQGLPIVFGFTVYEGFDSRTVEQTGYVQMPKTKEVAIGGHCVLMVGYTAGGHFIFRNSYGIDWGQKGYGFLPFEYAVNSDLAADFWVLNSIT